MTNIQSVAVKDIYDRIWKLPEPFRHHNVIHLMNGGKRPHIDAEQGFMTNEGKFVGREEAMIIAKNANQVLPRASNHYQGPELFSEDLWRD